MLIRYKLTTSLPLAWYSAARAIGISPMSTASRSEITEFVAPVSHCASTCLTDGLADPSRGSKPSDTKQVLSNVIASPAEGTVVNAPQFIIASNLQEDREK
jgi:hypothetical protein